MQNAIKAILQVRYDEGLVTKNDTEDQPLKDFSYFSGIGTPEKEPDENFIVMYLYPHVD